MIPSIELVELARTRTGQDYELGADVPLDDHEYAGPWDCAEFLSWLVYQKTRRLIGCVDNGVAVALAEPYSGGWAADARNGILGRTTIEAALATPGVALIRRPLRGRIGHVALSDGLGGTVEAHSRKHGVSAHRITGRVWDFAGLVPGFTYRSALASPPPLYDRPAAILRVGVTSARVVELKRALAARGFWDGDLEAATAPIFGRRTELAVARFQAARGLVRDGEAGPDTFRERELAA